MFILTTYLITGSNRGIGLEFVRQYAVENWKVIATCRDPKSALELKKIRGNVTIFPLDVTDFSAVEETSEVLKAEKIDILLNNAGIYDRLKKGLGESYEEVRNKKAQEGLLDKVSKPEDIADGIFSMIICRKSRVTP